MQGHSCRRVRRPNQELQNHKLQMQKPQLHFHYHASEIHETKMPPACEPLAQGQVVPEVLEVIGDNKPHVFQFPKQI